ncbi:hypothetical protein ACFQ9X_36060 [Catenulispora yoronensis]
MVMFSDGDADAAHRLLLAAVEASDPAAGDPATTEAMLGTLLLICHNSGRAELWETFETYLAKAATTATAPGGPAPCCPPTPPGWTPPPSTSSTPTSGP